MLLFTVHKVMEEGCGGLGCSVFTCLGVALQHKMCSVKHEASYVLEKVSLL